MSNAIVPRRPIEIRTATLEDLAFIDKLQKVESKAVGWMPTNSAMCRCR